mgnify:CR=1 FL=1
MNTVLYWLFTELPTDIWIRAMKNAWEQDPSDSILYTDVKDYYYAIILAFDYEKTPEGEVLDELNMKKMCCRRHFLTHVDIE